MKYLFTTLLFVSLNVYAQKPVLKFGKVTKEELELETCSFYEEADAMILGESGRLWFEYHDDKGWRYNLEVIRKIKIFNSKGKEQANVKVVLYDPASGSSREEMGAIKAFTYNLVDGKIEKTKLEGSEKFETRLNDYRNEFSFTLPNVNEGSVIEYKYQITSDYISNLYQWHFQSDIPKALSHFDYTIPEYFRYQVSQVGSYVDVKRELQVKEENFTYKWEQQGMFGQVEKGTGTLNSKSNRTICIATNILPVKEEPFMNNEGDIPARLESQLISIQMPNQAIKMIARTYDDFNTNILGWSSFGDAIKKGGFAKEKLATLSSSEEEKLSEIYSWIQSEISFNEVYGFTSSNAGRKALNNQKGSVAAINLTLVAALRAAGFEANPVILSTRGNGTPHPLYPSYEDFNYVIAAIKKGDKLILADAASNKPLGVLPVRCLNDKGWLASEKGGYWIELKNKARHSITVQTNISFNEEEMNTSTNVLFNGYAASEQKYSKTSKGEDGYEEFVVAMFEGDDEREIDFKSIDESGKMKWNLETTEAFDEQNLYIDPISYGGILENPFTRENRISNVDFPYEIARRVMVTIEVPAGYQVELPETTSLALPNKGGKFLFQAQQEGSKVSLISNFSLRKTVFSADEYGMLKQFYEMVVNKNKQLIVLKKT